MEQPKKPWLRAYEVVAEPLEARSPTSRPLPPRAPLDAVGWRAGADEHYYHAEWWRPGSWHPAKTRAGKRS